ncbi:hypothetical protein Ddye_023793 [Dipteronia dyeriana]|uniref:RNase H type-1 domain-containing protein n=1 Tax=Dipteronia dyeriana TaxID=168575 RepID=A0AAD9WTR7_9ROSI|nr:hypothetical protein Ddye_023793 [Dipteronia dyeriana]
MLNNGSHGRKLALKIDIQNAFDSISCLLSSKSFGALASLRVLLVRLRLFLIILESQFLLMDPLKVIFPLHMDYGRWLVGHHSKVHFLMDNWLGYPLIDLVDDRYTLQPPLDSVVSDIYLDIAGKDIPASFKASYLVVAYEIEKVAVSIDPDSLVWTCSLDEKDLRHLFLDCPFVRGLWDAISSTYGHKLKLYSICLNLWQESGTIKNSVDELQILQRLHVFGCPPKASRILEVNWHPPLLSCLKINMGRATFGSPGLAGFAWVFHTYRGFVKGCFAIPLGVCFAFEAELVVVVHAMDYAWTFGWSQLRLESDSTYLVDTLRSRSRKVPWH